MGVTLNENLFRVEVTAPRRSQIEGDVSLAVPLHLGIAAGALVALVLASSAVVLAASYARQEVVQGVVVPTGGTVRATASGGGVVVRMFVREGDEVAAGAPVATIRLSRDTVGGNAGTLVQGALEQEQQASDARERSLLVRLAAEREQLKERLANLRRARKESGDRLEMQAQRAALASANVERGRTMVARGYMSPLQLDERRDALLSLQDQTASLRTTQLALEREIIDAEARIRVIAAEEDEVRAEAARARASLRERAVAANANAVHELNSPVAGRVLSVPVDVGQELAAGATVAAIMPSQSRLEAELFIPSRSAGFVRPGQKVRLRFSAFPHRKFGAAVGSVRSISKTVLTPTEVSTRGFSVSEPVFRARVSIEKDWVNAYGQRIALQPGMTLDGTLVIENRSLLRWILDPIFARG